MSLPLMTEALCGLVEQSQFAVLKSVQQDGDTVESAQAVGYFLASMQPLHPREVLVKPEGLRKWKWFTMWTNKRDLLVNNYIRGSDGIQYRIMSKSDWSTAGYCEYEIVQGATMGSEAP